MNSLHGRHTVPSCTRSLIHVIEVNRPVSLAFAEPASWKRLSLAEDFGRLPGTGNP